VEESFFFGIGDIFLKENSLPRRRFFHPVFQPSDVSQRPPPGYYEPVIEKGRGDPFEGIDEQVDAFHMDIDPPEIEKVAVVAGIP
jgi:hypothetical protein